ncbi:MAG: HAD hydrolase-like protein [Pseudomonadota bacterium]
MNLYFDLDGTLIDSSLAAIKATQHTFQTLFGLQIDKSAIIDRMGIPIEVTFVDFGKGRVNAENLQDVIATFRSTYANVAPDSIRSVPGIEEIADTIEQISAACAIVTSKKTIVAERDLKSVNLHFFSKVIVGSDKVTSYKPDPDPLIVARHELGARKSAEIMIGDADVDMQMGKAAGVKTIGVTWGSHSADRLTNAGADKIAEAPRMLAEMLREIE